MNDVKATTKQPGAGNMILFLLLFLLPASFTYFSGLLLGIGLADDGTAATKRWASACCTSESATRSWRRLAFFADGRRAGHGLSPSRLSGAYSTCS